MGRRTGTPDLPLLYGSVPRWLSERMARLAGVDSPHAAIEGQPVGDIINLTDYRAAKARQAVARARLGNDDKLAALRELDRASKELDRAGEASFAEVVAKERMMSPALGGRTAGSADTVAPSAEKIVQR